MDQPKIEYPCKWDYCIIGEDETSLRQAVSEVLKSAQYGLSLSKTSKGGKYVSLELTTMVNNEEARNKIYASLRAHHSVKIVM